MEWLDQRFENYHKAAKDRRTIRETGDDVYTEVWKEIQEVVRAARKRGIDLQINGLPLHHTVRMGEHLLKIDLDKDKESITGESFGKTMVVLRFVLDAENAVFIENSGDPVSYAEAARRIMEPFLFGKHSAYASPGPDA